MFDRSWTHIRKSRSSHMHTLETYIVSKSVSLKITQQSTLCIEKLLNYRNDLLEIRIWKQIAAHLYQNCSFV